MELFILFFLILLNAFIVMCEMALVSAKKSRIETLANKEDKKAQIVLKL
ncbi:MAG: CNNM domain-containing protein, partial [Ginsengibacter sp.]